MKRAAAAIVVGGLLAACGISVTGIDPIAISADAGVVDGATTVVTLPDGNKVVVDGQIDPGPGPGDAKPDLTVVTYLDARTPVPTDCNENQCGDGKITAQSCFIESCNQNGGNRHWQKKVGGAVNDDSSLVCETDTGGYMESTLKAPSTDYTFYFQFITAETIPDGVTVAAMDFGDGRSITVSREGPKLKLCFGAQCVTKDPLPGSNQPFVVFGSLSTVSPYASATLTAGSACGNPVPLDISGGTPFPATWTAKVGCVAGNCSNYNWYDARIDLTPR